MALCPIDQHFGDDEMNDDRTPTIVPEVVDRILDRAELPSLPEAALRLLELCRDERVGTQEIVKVLELDAALSARLLRVANSSYFGQQYLVSTLTRAAVVLGNEHLRAAALGFLLTRGWNRLGHDDFDIREYWRDNIIRACLGRELATVMKLHPAEQAFLVNLLSDLGTIVMVTYYGSEYIDIYRQYRFDSTARCQVERDEFQTDHATVGRTLALRWKLPESLVTGIGRRCAEPPYMQTRDPSLIMWQLSYFCAQVPFAADKQTAQIKSALRHLAICSFGLSFEALSAAFLAAIDQFNFLRDVFSDLSPADCDATTLMAEASTLFDSIDREVAERVSIS